MLSKNSLNQIYEWIADNKFKIATFYLLIMYLLLQLNINDIRQQTIDSVSMQICNEYYYNKSYFGTKINYINDTNETINISIPISDNK